MAEERPSAPNQPGAGRDDLDPLEEERYRLSRDIHDGPAQFLTNLTLHLEVVERYVALADPRALEELRLLREEAAAAAREVRRVIYELVPPGLRQGDLRAALQGQCARLRERFGFTVHLDLAPDLQLSRTRQAAVFRVVQEALQNAMRHSGEREAWVSVRPSAGDLVVEVRDAGKGFDPHDVALQSGRHLGLAGMRDRASLAGGTLDVESAPDHGTRVTLRLPSVDGDTHTDS